MGGSQRGQPVDQAKLRSSSKQAPMAEIKKIGGQKNTTSHRFLRNIWEVVFLCNNTTSKKKSFINMPSFINYSTNMPCSQVHMWISVKFSFRKKLYLLTITASLLCLIVIRSCVCHVLGCAFFVQNCVFSVLSYALTLL